MNRFELKCRFTPVRFTPVPVQVCRSMKIGMEHAAGEALGMPESCYKVPWESLGSASISLQIPMGIARNSYAFNLESQILQVTSMLLLYYC